jgi:phosphoglucosamine mutase
VGKLFGTSGIRGVFGAEVTPELFIALGRALAASLGNSGTVVVGRDPRLSGPVLESALVSGLLAGGCDVALAGIVPTPVLALGTRIAGAKAGAMITASHNPPDYNGLKFWDGRGMAYSPELEERIEKILFGRKWGRTDWSGIGGCSRMDLLTLYRTEVMERVKLRSSLKVVVDCGNGAASVITPELLRACGCKVVSLNSNLDGRFPARGLEPTEENLKALARTVRALGADLGIAHDGDADRIGVVDERGRFLQDEMLALIAAAQVERGGDVVVTTVDASRLVDDAVAEAGGKVVRTRVGDVAVAGEVLRQAAVFGGEPSGSWIFPGIHLAPDGPLAALKVVEMVENAGRGLSELVDALPKYVTLRAKFECPNELKGEVMAEVSSELGGLGGEVNTADGIRVELEEGWVLVRPSGTEPCVRVTAEARSEAEARRLLERAGAAVREAVGSRRVPAGSRPTLY